MSHLKRLMAVLAVVSLVGTPSLANACNEGGHATSHGMRHGEPKLSKKLQSNRAVHSYMRANRIMHHDMNIAYTGNADVDFAAGMIPHHQGAVDMAEVQLKFGKDEELKELTRRIIVWQEAEIGMMKQWLSVRSSRPTQILKDEEANAEYKEAMDRMHRDMNIQYTGDADYDFVRGMIPHHQGAIDMAWVIKEHGTYPQLRALASEIIRSQQQEIALMQEWLAKHPAPEKPKKHRKNKKRNHGHASH